MGSLHCLNVGCADASVIQTPSATFLVDCHNIADHSSLLPASKLLRGVFITHQHHDHYSGLDYLYRAGYSVEHLIYSPYDRRWGDDSVTVEEWNEFNDLRDKFARRGSQTHTPYRQDAFDSPFWTTDGISFEIIGPARSVATSDTRELHDACLVVKAILNQRACLFTGDASDANLKYITDNTTNFCNDILHASHHGSINGAYLDFVKKCNAKHTLISTQSGVYDNVPHPTALQRYRTHTQNQVRRTDVDGTWKWDF